MICVEDVFVNMVGVKFVYMWFFYFDIGGQFLNMMKMMNYKVIINDIDFGDWNNVSFQ